MSDEQRPAAVLRFHDATFAPGACVIKAHEREHWVALEQMRREADVRIEGEVRAGIAAVSEALQRRGDELMAERLVQLSEAFSRAACTASASCSACSRSATASLRRRHSRSARWTLSSRTEQRRLNSALLMDEPPRLARLRQRRTTVRATHPP